MIRFTVALTLALTLSARAADAPPVRILHVVLAIDSASKLKESVAKDHQRIERLLRANIPADRMNLKIIAGNELTPANVVAYYRGLKVGPDDALLFFYAGHGAKDPTNGLAFVPQELVFMPKGQPVPPLFRSDVRDAMTKTGAGLVVLLTDCCSVHSKLAGKPFAGATRPVTPASATGIHPTLEHLFFRHRGVVDITAASAGEASWGDERDGGLFTRSLAKQLLRPPADLDTDGDKFVSWKEFFPILKQSSESSFQAWSAKMRTQGEAIDQKAQRPEGFSLGQPIPPPKQEPKAGPAVGVFAVICLSNESGVTLRFKYQWTGQKEWRSAEIADGKRGEFATPRGSGAELPRFLIHPDGNESPSELEADTWSGTGEPPPKAAGREYPIQLRK